MLPVPLADLIFWVAVVVCAVAQWFIVRLALVARDPAPDRSPGGVVVPATRRPAEIVWAVLPAVALALVLAATWRAIHPRRDLRVAPARAQHTAVAWMSERAGA